MSRPFLQLAGPILLIVSVSAGVRGQDALEVDSRAVNIAIDRGVAFLVSKQDVATHTWAEVHGQPGGLTAICALAILNTGVPATDPRVQPALDALCKNGKPTMVYGASLTIMALGAAYPTASADRRPIYAARMKEFALWLEAAQIKDGERKGGWRYSRETGQGDNSNAQFALLALHEAEKTLPDLKIQDQTWRLALQYFTEQQAADGSWSYIKGARGDVFGSATGSMTCAGISSVIIASGQLGESAARVSEGNVLCCGVSKDDDAVERGLSWLGKHFSVEKNPGSSSWHLYYLYGMERVGRLTGRRFFYSAKGTPRDWYREGAEYLMKKCREEITGQFFGNADDEARVPELSTAFSLLFLAKGRRPVVMAKLHFVDASGRMSDQHRYGVPNLTAHVEKLWKKDLSWQTIDLPHSSVNDLLEAPILFMSGSETFNLADAEKRALKDYVQQGGFLFAEACEGNGCSGAGFDRSFRDLVKELFPESALRLLPPDHPVWFAEEKVNPKFVKPLYGVDTCCRTSVVYCPENLSCFWELKRPPRGRVWPADVEAEIDACAAIGANVAAYATNRELKEKLDRPKFVFGSGPTDRPTRAALAVPKLSHGGGSDDAPNALRNLLHFAEKQLEIRVDTRPLMLPADQPALLQYPLLFLHGRRSFRLSAAERDALHTYLDRGGFVFGDAICAQEEFTTSWKRELEQAFPEGKWSRIPSDHALFTNEYRGFDIKKVALRDPQARGADDKLTARITSIEPYLEGFEVHGRYVAIFSPYDLSCALENSQSLECKGYTREDAARLAANIILYGLAE